MNIDKGTPVPIVPAVGAFVAAFIAVSAVQAWGTGWTALADELAQGGGGQAPQAETEDDKKKNAEDDEGQGDGVSLPEVVVTAPKVAAPMTVVTDPKAPRQPVPPADGAGYLKNIPGFSVIRKGGSGGDIVLRGLGGSRVNVLLDGTSLLGGCGGRMDPPTAYVFPESYDKITVLKGPQSVTHGGGFSGGAVLMDRDTEQFKDLGFRGTLSGLFGGFGRNDQMFDLATGTGFGYVRAIGTRAESGNYADGNGSKVHSEYLRRSGTMIVGLTPDEFTTIEGSADLSKARAAYADRTMDGPVFDRRDYKLEVTRRDLAPWLPRINAQVYDNYIDHVMDRSSMRVSAMKMLSNPDRKHRGGKAEVDLVPTGGMVLTLGADHNVDKRTTRSLTNAEYNAGTDYKTKPRLDDIRFETTGLYAELKQELGDAGRMVLGYRFNQVETTKWATDGITVQNTDDDGLHNALARYEHDLALRVPLTAYASLAYSQRAPDNWERANVFDLANEKTTQVDMGVMFEHGPWRGSASVFHAWIDDYILLDGTVADKNVDARTLGGEAEVAYRFLPSWTIDATLAYVRGHNATDGRALAQMPPLETTLGVRFDDGTFLGGMHLRAVAEQNRYDTGWGGIAGKDIDRTGGFGVLSMNAGWRPRKGALLSAGVDNIFNKTYAEHISKASTGAADLEQTVRVNEPGRTFWLKGSISF